MSPFIFAILFGLAAAATTTIIRALVPTLWLLRKPLSCDLCMSWWTSLGLGLVFASDTAYGAIVLLASVTISMLALKIINRLSEIRLEDAESSNTPE